MASNNVEKDDTMEERIAHGNQKNLVTIAKIGLIGTIFTAIIALITALVNPDLLAFLFHTPIPTVMVTPESTKTDSPSPMPPTVTPSPLPTLTDIPATKVETPATATIHPTSIPGDDWAMDCIDLTTWAPYLASGAVSDAGYCSQLAAWGITAQDGTLFLNTLRSQSAAKEYGLSTSLPMRAEIEFMVNVKELESSEIWIGIFDSEVSDKFSGYVFVIQPGASMDFRKLPATNVVNNQEYVYVTQYYPIRIILDAGKITVWVSKNKMVSDYPIEFTNRELFIGYRSLPNTQLDASIYDLKITTP